MNRTKGDGELGVLKSLEEAGRKATVAVAVTLPILEVVMEVTLSPPRGLICAISAVEPRLNPLLSIG